MRVTKQTVSDGPNAACDGRVYFLILAGERAGDRVGPGVDAIGDAAATAMAVQLG